MNYYSDNPDWQWLIKNAVDWKKIFNLYGNSEMTVDEVEDVLSLMGKWSSEKLSPRARELDSVGAGEVKDGKTILSDVLKETYREASELGVYGLTVPEEYSGSGMPFSVGMFSFALMARGCLATTCQMTFFGSIADMLERFCDKETAARLIPKVTNGELSGSMCLTEPGAGSDLGNLKSSAVKNTDGTYTLNGSKIFITNAGGGLAFTLARVKGAPEGTAGISMFLVEQEIERGGEKVQNYRVTKNEEKLGLKGTFTCEVVYEDSIATLVGEENMGFGYMLHLMNQSRIGVGLQAIGGIEASLGYLEEYAKERKAFGKSLLELPLYYHNFKSWSVERDALRALIADTISDFDVYRILSLRQSTNGDLNKEETVIYKDALNKLRTRTPLVKYYASEAYLSISTKVMQGMGSFGYMKEYEAERFHRESFGPLMYEGTSQIQALMALKDTIKMIAKNPTAFMGNMVSGHPVGRAVTPQNKFLKRCKSLRYEFNKNLASLLMRSISGDVVETLKKLIGRENLVNEEAISKLMIHAETITEAMSYLETIDVLGKHAQKESSRQTLFENYNKLIAPRLKGVYESWRQVEYA